MYNLFFYFLLSVFLLTQISKAQWQRVANLNVGNTGKITVHGSAIFAYGFQGSYQIHRSTTNGTSWINISSVAPGQFSDIFSFNGMLYACYLSTVYISTDLGTSWNILSNVTVTGNGALIGFAADGGSIYVFSNRKSVFKSTNNGANWTEAIINNSANFVMVDFAARGNRYAAVVTGVNAGVYISEDAGINWALHNPSTAASGIYSYDNSLYAFTFGGGVFRMQDGTTNWLSANNGLPNSGSYVIPKSPTSFGNVIYFGFQQLVSNIAGVARSTDAGISWTLLDTVGLPTTMLAGSAGVRYVAVTPSEIFYYYYSTNTSLVGVYRMSLTTGVNEIASEIPKNLLLNQNYPNPFNPSTKISWQSPAGGYTTLKVYDVLGNEVATLVDEYKNAGSYEVEFNAGQISSLSSGVYFYRVAIHSDKIQAGDFMQTKKMILTK